MASRFGYCEVTMRAHQLGDFHSREMINSNVNTSDGRRYPRVTIPGSHEEVCRNCGKRPGE